MFHLEKNDNFSTAASSWLYYLPNGHQGAFKIKRTSFQHCSTIKLRDGLFKIYITCEISKPSFRSRTGSIHSSENENQSFTWEEKPPRKEVSSSVRSRSLTLGYAYTSRVSDTTQRRRRQLLREGGAGRRRRDLQRRYRLYCGGLRPELVSRGRSLPPTKAPV